MSKSTPIAPATAADVRAFAASKGITVGERGRLSASLVAEFTKATNRKYAVGTERSLPVEVRYTQASGRTAKKTVFVPESEARTIAGDLAGKRGPLSKAALAKVAEAKGDALSVAPVAKPVDATPKA